MPTARAYLGVGAINGKLYAVGGIDNSTALQVKVEEYDPVANFWLTRLPMPAGRRDFGAAVIGDKFYAVGGTRATATSTVTSDVVEEYYLGPLGYVLFKN